MSSAWPVTFVRDRVGAGAPSPGRIAPRLLSGDDGAAHRAIDERERAPASAAVPAPAERTGTAFAEASDQACRMKTARHSRVLDERIAAGRSSLVCP